MIILSLCCNINFFKFMNCHFIIFHQSSLAIKFVNLINYTSKIKLKFLFPTFPNFMSEMSSWD